jgi:hypothetical protein
MEAHPWLGPQLFTAPWQPAMVQLWEQIGRPVEELGVPEGSLFTAVSTLVSYIVGVGSQNAVNTHSLAAHHKRDDFLDAVAARWEASTRSSTRSSDAWPANIELDGEPVTVPQGRCSFSASPPLRVSRSPIAFAGSCVIRPVK